MKALGGPMELDHAAKRARVEGQHVELHAVQGLVRVSDLLPVVGFDSPQEATPIETVTYHAIGQLKDDGDSSGDGSRLYARDCGVTRRYKKALDFPI